MLAGRAVEASGTVSGGTAPDTLVAAGAVTVLTRGRVEASGAVRRRTAPFAVLLVIAVFMLARRRMNASGPIGRAAAISAFRAHVAYYNTLLALLRNPQSRRHPKMLPDDLTYASCADLRISGVYHLLQHIHQKFAGALLDSACLALARTGHVQDERNGMLDHKELTKPPLHLPDSIRLIQRHHEM